MYARTKCMALQHVSGNVGVSFFTNVRGGNSCTGNEAESRQARRIITVARLHATQPSFKDFACNIRRSHAFNTQTALMLAYIVKMRVQSGVYVLYNFELGLNEANDTRRYTFINPRSRQSKHSLHPPLHTPLHTRGNQMPLLWSEDHPVNEK